MSLEVADSVWISTHTGWAATKDGPFNAFDLFGEKAEARLWHRPLHEATGEIYALTHAADRFDTEVMQQMRRYIKGLNLVPIENTGSERKREAFEPSSLSASSLTLALGANGGSEEFEPIVFLGNPLPQEGFVHLVNYVMTNTAIWAEDLKGQVPDPRLDMVEQFRSEA